MKVLIRIVSDISIIAQIYLISVHNWRHLVLG